MERYEIYRRSNFPKALMRRFLSSLTGWPHIPASVPIILAGVGKLFVGEMVEGALAVQREWGDPPGPLRPQHLREAFRLYRERTANIQASAWRRRLF